jgi:glycosyltransferase involved in cell wall biosynthesis
MVEIFINGRFLTQPMTGVQRYATELVKALDRLIDRGEIDTQRFSYSMVVPRGTELTLDLRRIPVRVVGRLSGYLWEQVELPWHVRRGFLVNLCNMAPLLKRRQSVTIHDAAVFVMPETFSFVFRSWYRLALKYLSKHDAQVIIVSAFAGGDLARFLSPRTERMAVVHHGGEHLDAIQPDDRFPATVGLGETPFLLTVGSMNRRKNFASIIEAVRLIEGAEFVVAVTGTVNPKVFGNISTVWPQGFRHVGHVSDNQLKALYMSARAFIFPSFYEGFGLPALEAMACGCPVIAADIPSLREVCGDAAVYCDPYRPLDIAEKIRLVMADKMLRDDLRRRGLERARLFTWEKCARETAAIIHRAAAG